MTGSEGTARGVARALLVVLVLVLGAGCSAPPAGTPDPPHGWPSVVSAGGTGTAMFTVSGACGIVPRGTPAGEPDPVAFDYRNATLSPPPERRFSLPAWAWGSRQSSVRVSVPYRVRDRATAGRYTYSFTVLEGCSGTGDRRIENRTVTVVPAG